MTCYIAACNAGNHIRVLVHVLAILLPKIPGKAAEVGPSVWAPGSHVEDQAGTPASRLLQPFGSKPSEGKYIFIVLPFK